MKLIVLIRGLILSMFVAPFYAQATETTVTSVDFPCRDSSGATCQVGLEACEKIVPTISGLVAEKAENEIKYAYQGINIDYTLTTDASQPKGTKVKRLCNAATGEGVSKQTNDYGQDCGDFADLSVKPITIKLDGREKSFLRGAKIQAKRCYLKQIEDELASRKLRVTNEACQALAQDVDALTKRNRSVASAATEDAGQSFCQEASDMSGADFCREGASSADPEKMKHLQATCHVAAASSATASALGQLATCELNARTERAYTETFYTESAHSSLIDKITSEVGKNCEKEAKNKCNDWSRTCLTREGQACYERELPKWMKEYLNEKFPSSGQCAQNTENQDGSGGLPFLPILPFMMGSLRRRSKKAGKAVVVILSTAFALLGTGCSDICETYGSNAEAAEKEMETEKDEEDLIFLDDSTQDNESDWGIFSNDGLEDTEDAEAVATKLAEWKDAGCEIAEEVADDDDDDCADADCGSSGGGDSSGASATRTAAASLGNAESFVSEDEAVASGGSPETSAATAGDSGDTSYGSGESSDDTATAANRNVAGGGSDSGAGSGGGGSGLGSLGTSSGGSSAASALESAATVGDEAPGSAYSSGGAPGGGSGSKKKGSDNPFANLFGAKPGEGTAAGANEMSFGNASADGGAMQSMDPENYFSLIDVNANIFQVVEKRYQKKSMDWALLRKP